MSTSPRGSDSVAKIAGLTVVNAMVFQEVLADYEAQVHHLRQTLQSADAISAFDDDWKFILTQINYYPIFHVAHQLLLALPSSPDSEAAVRSLAKTALEIVQQRAALRHDLMGPGLPSVAGGSQVPGHLLHLRPCCNPAPQTCPGAGTVVPGLE